MSNFCLTLCRFSLCAWIGAAALFVAAGVAEVRSPAIDAATKNALVGARFPHYYRFGFAMVGTGFAAAVLGRNSAGWTHRRAAAVAGLTLAALVIMAADYATIYAALLEMSRQQTPPAEFEPYHKASKWINGLGLSIVLAAALAACWPARRGTELVA